MGDKMNEIDDIIVEKICLFEYRKFERERDRQCDR